MDHRQLLRLTHEIPMPAWLCGALGVLMLGLVIGSILEMRKKPHARWLVAFALILLAPLLTRCLRHFIICDRHTYLLLALWEPPLIFIAFFCLLRYLQLDGRLTPELKFGLVIEKLFIFLTCISPAFSIAGVNLLSAIQVNRALLVTGLCLVGGVIGFHTYTLEREKRLLKAGGAPAPAREESAFFSAAFNPAVEHQPSRKVQTLELLIVLFLIFVPLFHFFPQAQSGAAKLSYSQQANSRMLWDIPRICLILYLLWRNREPFARIGLTGKRLGGNFAIGIAGYFGLRIVTGMVSRAAFTLGLRSSHYQYNNPHHPGEIAYSVIYVAVGVFIEELFYRGYLLLRLTAILRNLPAAVLLSSLLFALQHLYQGWPGVIGAGIGGIFYALIFVECKSLLPSTVMHFLRNFVLSLTR
jgi:membrane protease YdiL (CAAX protease family)